MRDHFNYVFEPHRVEKITKLLIKARVSIILFQSSRADLETKLIIDAYRFFPTLAISKLYYKLNGLRNTNKLISHYLSAEPRDSII